MRVGALIGSATGRPPRKRGSLRRRVLFVSADVIGLGHLTRQLAVARRCAPHIDPIFATSSQGFSVAKQAGFEVEYIPHYDQARFDIGAWNDWLAVQLGQIMEAHSVDGIVFDGASPHDGIIEAMKNRRRLVSIWVRRTMWRKQQTKHVLDRQRYFHLVIEPGDIASANDGGATRDFRCGVMTVPPIRLLDREEMLDRSTAAARLGLDLQKPAVLIQLGADITRDVAALVDRILAALAPHPDVQPVLAEWNISAVPLDLWPTLRRLRGFPFSRYYSAFDFSISAAGYNSFNELIAFQVPTIFLSNTNRATDDQPARAFFAQENGAALALPEHDAVGLRVGIESLLQEKARSFLKANCQKLMQPNGAAAAAEAIAVMVE
jgi:UDP:flavonoid glycosyltransferase YjiC (YdhE family)